MLCAAPLKARRSNSPPPWVPSREEEGKGMTPCEKMRSSGHKKSPRGFPRALER
jgi:hypothetical protein